MRIGVVAMLLFHQRAHGWLHRSLADDLRVRRMHRPGAALTGAQGGPGVPAHTPPCHATLVLAPAPAPASAASATHPARPCCL
jgi:hypothetical protein